MAYNSTHQLSIDQAANAVLRCDDSQKQGEKEKEKKLHVKVFKFRMKIL
jgi:hypothetical protein